MRKTIFPPRFLALLLALGLALPANPALRPPAAGRRPPGRPPAVLSLGPTASLFLAPLGARLPWSAEAEKICGRPALRTEQIVSAGTEERLAQALGHSAAGTEEIRLAPPEKELSVTPWDNADTEKWQPSRLNRRPNTMFLIKETILPSVVASNPEGHRAQILSVGSSTGEEPAEAAVMGIEGLAQQGKLLDSQGRPNLFVRAVDASSPAVEEMKRRLEGKGPLRYEATPSEAMGLDRANQMVKILNRHLSLLPALFGLIPEDAAKLSPDYYAQADVILLNVINLEASDPNKLRELFEIIVRQNKRGWILTSYRDLAMLAAKNRNLDYFEILEGPQKVSYIVAPEGASGIVWPASWDDLRKSVVAEEVKARRGSGQTTVAYLSTMQELALVLLPSWDLVKFKQWKDVHSPDYQEALDFALDAVRQGRIRLAPSDIATLRMAQEMSGIPPPIQQRIDALLQAVPPSDLAWVDQIIAAGTEEDAPALIPSPSVPLAGPILQGKPATLPTQGPKNHLVLRTKSGKIFWVWINGEGPSFNSSTGRWDTTIDLRFMSTNVLTDSDVQAMQSLWEFRVADADQEGVHSEWRMLDRIQDLGWGFPDAEQNKYHLAATFRLEGWWDFGPPTPSRPGVARVYIEVMQKESPIPALSARDIPAAGMEGMGTFDSADLGWEIVKKLAELINAREPLPTEVGVTLSNESEGPALSPVTVLWTEEKLKRLWLDAWIREIRENLERIKIPMVPRPGASGSWSVRVEQSPSPSSVPGRLVVWFRLKPAAGTEEMIREVSGNPAFRTYVIADPLMSMLERPPKRQAVAMAIPPPAVQKNSAWFSYLNGLLENGVKMTRAFSELQDKVPALVELEKLVREGDVVLLKLSVLLHPERYPSGIGVGEPGSIFLNRSGDEYLRGIVWEERIHLALDRLDAEQRGHILEAIRGSNHSVVAAIANLVQEVTGHPLRTTENAEEVFPRLLWLYRDSDFVQRVIQEVFPSHLAGVVSDIQKRTDPSAEDIHTAIAVARTMEQGLQEQSYFETLRDFMNRKTAERHGTGSKEGSERKVPGTEGTGSVFPSAAGAEEQLRKAVEAWEGFVFTPPYEGVRRGILPVFYAEKTLGALPLAVKAGPVLILAASKAERQAVEKLLTRLSIPSNRYEIRMILGKEEEDISYALALARRDFSERFEIYPVDPDNPGRPDWLKDLLLMLGEQGQLPAGEVGPAVQSAQDYFQFV